MYGKQVAYGDTLADALTQVFSAPVETQQGTSGTSGLLSPQSGPCSRTPRPSTNSPRPI